MDLSIKADPSRPHHYFIAVAIHSPQAGKPRAGKYYLKYGPLYFNHSDIIDLQHAAMLTTDKLFKTSSKEALSVCNREIAHSISAMKIAARVNQCTMHHFSSDILIDEEHFEMIVNLSNHDVFYEELLDKALMRY